MPDREAFNLEARLEGRNNASAAVRAFTADVREARRELEALPTSRTVTLDLRVNGEDKIRGLEGRLNAIRDENVNIDVNVDQDGSGRRNIDMVSNSMERADLHASGLNSRLKDTAAWMGILAAPGIITGIAAIPPVLSAAAAGATALTSSLAQGAAGAGLYAAAGEAMVLGLRGYVGLARAAVSGSELVREQFHAQAQEQLEMQRATILNTDAMGEFIEETDRSVLSLTRMQAELGRRILPSLTEMMQIGRRIGPDLAEPIYDAAQATSEMAANFVRAQTQGGELRELRNIVQFMAGSMERGAEAAVDLFAGAINLAQPLIPIMARLQGNIVDVANAFNLWSTDRGNRQNIADFAERSLRFFNLWAGAAVDLAAGLVNIGRSVDRSGLTGSLSNDIADLADNFHRLTKEGGNWDEAIQDFSRRSGPLLRSIGRAALELGRQFFRVSDEIIGFREEGHKLTTLEEIFDAVHDAFKPLGNLLINTFESLGPIMPGLIRNIAELLETFAGSTDVLEFFLRGISHLLDWFNDLPGPVKSTVAQFVALQGIFSLLTGGGIGSIGGVLGGITNLAQTTALLNGERAGAGLGAMVGTLGRMAGIVAVGGVLALGVAAIAGGLYLAYKHNEDFRDSVNRLMDGLGQKFSGVGDTVKHKLVPAFAGMASNAADALLDILDVDLGRKAADHIANGVGDKDKGRLAGKRVADATASAYQDVLGKRSHDATVNAFAQVAAGKSPPSFAGVRVADATVSAYRQELGKKAPDATASAYAQAGRQAAKDKDVTGEGGAFYELGFAIGSATSRGLLDWARSDDKRDGGGGVAGGFLSSLISPGAVREWVRERFTATMSGAFAGFKWGPVTKELWGNFLDSFTGSNSPGDKINKFIDDEILDPIVKQVKKLGPRIHDALMDQVRESWLGPFIWLADKLVGNSVIPEMIDDIVGIIKKMPGRVMDIIKGFGNNFLDWWRDKIWDPASEYVQEKRDGILKTLGNLKDRGIAWIKSLVPSWVQDWRKDIWDPIAKYVQDKKEGILQTVGNLKRDLLKIFDSLPKPIRDIFELIGKNMWQPIDAAAGNIDEAIHFAFDIVNLALKAFGQDTISLGGGNDNSNNGPNVPTHSAMGGPASPTGQVAPRKAVGGYVDGSREVYVVGDKGQREYIINPNRPDNLRWLSSAAYDMGYGVVPLNPRAAGGAHPPERHAAGGQVDPNTGMRMFASGGAWYPQTAALNAEVESKWPVQGSTYPGHGADGDAKNSIDWMTGQGWGVVATGQYKQIGDEIVNFLLTAKKSFMDYIIWMGQMWDSGGVGPYRGGGGYPAPTTVSGFHRDHVHAETLENNPGPSVGSGGALGTSLGPTLAEQIWSGAGADPKGWRGTIASQAARALATFIPGGSLLAGLAGSYPGLVKLLPDKLPSVGSGTFANAADNYLGGYKDWVHDWVFAQFGGSSGSTSSDALGGDPAKNRALAHQMLQDAGWGGQISPFDQLAMAESGYNRFARNPSSGAYGIPQALPESKLPFAGQEAGGSHAGPQLGWMLDYIRGRYNDPAGAWGFHQSHGWYKEGGVTGKELNLKMPSRTESAFVTVADTLRAMVGKASVMKLGDDGGVGDGKHLVAITNEAGPEGIAPLDHWTPGGQQAYDAMHPIYSGRRHRGGWMAAGGLTFNGPLASQAINVARSFWGPSGASFGYGPGWTVRFHEGTGAARTGNGIIGVDWQWGGSDLFDEILGHEIGHAGGLPHAGPPAALMTNPVMRGDRPLPAELQAFAQNVGVTGGPAGRPMPGGGPGGSSRGGYGGGSVNTNSLSGSGTSTSSTGGSGMAQRASMLVQQAGPGMAGGNDPAAELRAMRRDQLNAVKMQEEIWDRMLRKLDSLGLAQETVDRMMRGLKNAGDSNLARNPVTGQALAKGIVRNTLRHTLTSPRKGG